MQKMLRSKTVSLFIVVCLLNVTVSGCGKLQVKVYYDRDEPYKKIKDSADNNRFIKIIYEGDAGEILVQRGYLSRSSRDENIVILTGEKSSEKVEIPYNKIVEIYDIGTVDVMKVVGGFAVGTAIPLLILVLSINGAE